MADDHIRYDILAQDALRGVMRKVLAEVARTGLPGNHHFFITFLTNAPGVRVSSRLRERYPEQMTIVLQFQYWDLKVTETGFEVGLSFSDVPEKLEVPFAAVRGFYDPSVNFELEFDVKPEVTAHCAGRSRRRKRSPTPRRRRSRRSAPRRPSRAPRPSRRRRSRSPSRPTTPRRAPTSFRSTLSARSRPAMAEIVNLRVARKRKAREDAERDRRGEPRAVRPQQVRKAARSQRRRTRRAAFVDGHRRDSPDGK